MKLFIIILAALALIFAGRMRRSKNSETSQFKPSPIALEPSTKKNSGSWWARNRRLRVLRGLTIASLKMYFRNRTAVFFSLFFPILFIVIFGTIFNSAGSSFKLDVTNESKYPASQQFIAGLEKISAFKLTDVTLEQGKTDLNNGNTDLQIVIPTDFGQTANGQYLPATIATYYNLAKPQNGQAANLILTQLVAGINTAITHTAQVITVTSIGVATKNLSYIDFLLPGMVGLSIMQLGIFSVAFAFVSFKTTGMLRRVQATPTHPSNFLAAQGLTRLIIAVAQTILLALIGVWFFHFHLSYGSWVPFLLVALIGSTVFMGIGFIIAGWAKNEDQAQPVATLIQFPMMFLSGIFFPRDGFPHWLQVITGYLPLTYLGDALRQIANNQVSLWAVRSDLLGLLIWGVIAYVVAVLVFSWE